MIIFADLHLRPETEDVVFGEVFPGLREAIAGDVVSGKEPAIACLGDFFHIRYQVDVRLFNRARDELREWARSVPVLLLPGNHDQYNIEGRNILESLGDISGVTVYNEPTWDAYGRWLPYRKNLAATREQIAVKGPAGAPRRLFMHQEVQGAWMNTNKRADEGLGHSDFESWEVVLSGHWHLPQSMYFGDVPVYYVGSPYQTKADEAGQEKGFVILENNVPEFVTRTWGPRYHSFFLGPGEVPDWSSIREGDVVKIQAAPGTDVAALSKSLPGTQLAISVQNTEVQQRLQVSDQADLEEYARAYVALKRDDLADQNALMRTFGEVYMEVSRG